MSVFTIGIFGRNKHWHAGCFEDFARALADALRQLDHETVDFLPDGRPGGRLIGFGINNSSMEREPTEARFQMPPDTIVFNTEQLAAVEHPEQFMQNHAFYKEHVVWDYSKANIVALNQLGIKRAVHCPLGYIQSMEYITPAAEEDIDVLFYGSTNPARLKVLDGLDAAGLKVKRLFGVYGAERDAWIARSKVVLNMHHYANGIFEIFRVSHLLANKKCVVSEAGGCDNDLELLALRTTAYVPRHQLVEECRIAVNHWSYRRNIAKLGYEEFKNIDLVANVRRALEQSQ